MHPIWLLFWIPGAIAVLIVLQKVVAALYGVAELLGGLV